MMTFLIEAFVLCVLFHLEVLLQVRREPAKRVYGYPPSIVERYIELGKIPDKKNPSTLERVKKKWPAAIVIDILWLCHSKVWILPGTEDMTAVYHDYGYHVKSSCVGMLIGLPVCLLIGLVVQAISWIVA